MMPQLDQQLWGCSELQMDPGNYDKFMGSAEAREDELQVCDVQAICSE
jgi:hypothetical protein